MPPEERNLGPAVESDASIEDVYERVRSIGAENQRILEDLMAGESRFRRLAKAVWQVQEDERRRLARELHDGIGQTLTALKNHLEGLAATAAADASPGFREAVELAAQALEDTRELSRLLRPPVLDDLGLPAALRWLGRTTGQRFGFAVDVTAEELTERLPAEIETVLFRIAQEALTNAAKHASADTVTITLERPGEQMILRVVDDGSGFETSAAAHGSETQGVGLRGMQDRVELFDGRLEVDSRPGAGTQVRAVLPLSSRGGS